MTTQPRVGTFIWNELITPDQRASGNFYNQLFGWDRKEVDAGPPFGRYTIFQLNGKDIAGMMNATIEYTRNLGACWYGYIGVDDVAACAARAHKNSAARSSPARTTYRESAACASWLIQPEHSFA